MHQRHKRAAQGTFDGPGRSTWLEAVSRRSSIAARACWRAAIGAVRLPAAPSMGSRPGQALLSDPTSLLQRLQVMTVTPSSWGEWQSAPLGGATEPSLGIQVEQTPGNIMPAPRITMSVARQKTTFLPARPHHVRASERLATAGLLGARACTARPDVRLGTRTSRCRKGQMESGGYRVAYLLGRATPRTTGPAELQDLATNPVETGRTAYVTA